MATLTLIDGGLSVSEQEAVAGKTREAAQVLAELAARMPPDDDLKPSIEALGLALTLRCRPKPGGGV
jgi:hypothetical protein